MQRVVAVSPLFTLIFLAGVLGCGGDSGRGPTGTISGKVTLNGKPVPAGTRVNFASNTGDATSAEISGDGSFTIMGVTVGSYQVSFSPPAARSEALSPEEAMKMAHGTGPGGAGANPKALAEATTDAVPKKYTDFSTSGVTFDVKEGSNDFVLDMK
jgi:hypothetical protein